MKKKVPWRATYCMTLAFFLFLTSCNPNHRYYKIISQADNVLTLKIYGWEYTCDSPKIFVEDGGVWVEVIYPPYNPMGYYLDDLFIDLGLGCDVKICVNADSTRIGLYNYVSTGERESPFVIFGEEPSLVPSYQREPLHGKIKIILTVYLAPDGDWNCAKPMPVEIIINN